ncbi:MAG: DUF58 domain-containing protein [Gemmatimonadaceae bacterium]|nr:DUF58 domain-containing protein [Gemmatimonadaceae bacterium]
MIPELSAYGPLLDALRGVRWPARRAVGAAPAGVHRSIQRGTAGEFTEYRVYRQGDDPKTLDWKLLARSDRAFVRVSEDRALLNTWFLVDGSGRMAFRGADAASNVLSKWDMARQITMGLAAVAHAASDPVGLVVGMPSAPARLSPRARRGTIADVARVLGAQTVHETSGGAALAPLLSSLSARSRIVIVSDALGDLDALLKIASAQVVAGAIIEFVHVVSVAEIDPPAGTFFARDPDMNGRGNIMPARGREAYQEAFAAFREDVAVRWRAAGCGYREVRTSEIPARAVRGVIAGLATST